jgi:prolyl-tRNA synthetase
MLMSSFFAPTLREIPAEAETISHKLMLRAGFIRKLAAGIYSLLPLGWKVMQKIQNIVREEMNCAGGQEVLLPFVLPAELWKETGRWDIYGKELLRVKDRSDREFCFGPTHEEVITDLVRNNVKSYRELPLNLYQIQTKFRDEIRPRFGVMRAREFIMKDAYSFDKNEEGLENNYKKMYKAYNNIFERCGLKFRVVEADSGLIGGNASHEFMVLSDTGEDLLTHCTSCNYAANLDLAARKQKPEANQIKENDNINIKKISTPDVKTTEQLAGFLKISTSQVIKTLIYKADGQVVAVLIRGDHELSEVKLKNSLKAQTLEMADAKTIKNLTGADVGFSGPVNLKGAKIIADFDIEKHTSYIVGANENDAHLINVIANRDFHFSELADLKKVCENDLCPRCENGKLKLIRGIEVGHIFKLGTKYSEPMHCVFSDEDGKIKPMIMGCYGIGISRTAAAAIEQNHDEQGIVWPKNIAPFNAIIIVVNPKDEQQKKLGLEIYENLREEKKEVILDDRAIGAGVKFKDADLIGFPTKIIIGPKALEQNKIEIKERASGKTAFVSSEQILSLFAG